MLIEILFIFAFILNIASAMYAFHLYKRLRGGSLQKVALAAAFSALTFGIHHLGEAIFIQNNMMIVSESVELISHFLLIWAIYELYKLTRI